MEYRNPPKLRKGRISERWIAVVDDLKQHPGEWAFIDEFSPSVSTDIKNGDYPAFMPERDMEPDDRKAWMDDNYEVTTSNSESGGGRRQLFIRYIGKPVA